MKKVLPTLIRFAFSLTAGLGYAQNVILPRFRGQSHYAASAAVCDLNSNSIGLT